MILITVNRIFYLMEMFGLKKLDTKSNAIRFRMHQAFIFMQISSCALFDAFHMYSTFTRSTRYLPEFCQMLLEDVIAITVFGFLLYIQANGEGLHSLKHFETHSFSQAIPKVVKKYQTKATIAFSCVFCVVAGAIAGGFLEALLPIASSELVIRQHVYRTSHPERRHPYNLRLPFLDESKSWAYEIIFIWIFYVNTAFILGSTMFISILPVSITLLQGQYIILAHYVEKIGKKHTDEVGNRILYTNIEKNKFSSEEFVMKTKYKNREVMFKWKELNSYERRYLKQILRFHQKLIKFQEKVSEVSCRSNVL